VALYQVVPPAHFLVLRLVHGCRQAAGHVRPFAAGGSSDAIHVGVASFGRPRAYPYPRFLCGEGVVVEVSEKLTRGYFRTLT
jgi:hypothetical protein